MDLNITHPPFILEKLILLDFSPPPPPPLFLTDKSEPQIPKVLPPLSVERNVWDKNVFQTAENGTFIFSCSVIFSWVFFIV